MNFLLLFVGGSSDFFLDTGFVHRLDLSNIDNAFLGRSASPFRERTLFGNSPNFIVEVMAAMITDSSCEFIQLRISGMTRNEKYSIVTKARKS